MLKKRSEYIPGSPSRVEVDGKTYAQGAYKDPPWTEQEKNFAAMVSRLDSDVGRLLALLKELGIDGKTLVMFSGDNGAAFAPDSPAGRRFEQSMGGRLRGHKRSLYEGGLRQPAMARWPGLVPAGRVSDEPWAFWDVLPTAAELAGAKMPSGFASDGLSLVSFPKGARRRRATASTGSCTSRGARSNGAGKPIELYDLAADGAESRDLAAVRPELVRPTRS